MASVMGRRFDKTPVISLAMETRDAMGQERSTCRTDASLKGATIALEISRFFYVAV
jgi:hypothetical protein